MNNKKEISKEDMMIKDNQARTYGAARLSSRTIIEEKIKKHQRSIEQLQALYRELPYQLSYEADECLWKFLVRGE